MGTVDIQAEINSIPAKKEDLRKAFEELESYSSSFASFPLQWKDIDDHFSSIEKSIDKRFQELKAKVAPAKPTADVAAENIKLDQDKPVIYPLPELKSLCVKMDAKALRLYIIGHLKNNEAMRRELGSALLCSPDPVALVLDSFEGFVQSSELLEGHLIRRAYSITLECFHGLKLEVKPSEKERARQMAKECGDMTSNDRNHRAVVVMVLFHLIVSFGLFEYYANDYILNLLVTMANRKKIVDLCRNSGLEEKIPDLIKKLNKKGRQLDSIKFVLAFNLQHKFPPSSLFEAYIKKSEEGLPIWAMKGHNSAELKLKGISKQIVAVKAVKRAVIEYNLGSHYSLAKLENRLEQLQILKLQNRVRPSDSSKTQPQFGPVDQSSNMANSDGLIAAPPSVCSLDYPVGLGESPAPPTSSYIHPSPGSGYSDRSVSYGGYSNSGFPPHNTSHYP